MSLALRIVPVFVAASLSLFAGRAAGQVVLRSFAGGNSDGATPQGALIQVGTGLYGTTTSGGGSADAGTIFQIGTTGNGYGQIYAFKNGSDGNGPLGSLTAYQSFLYGTAALAGSAGQGTVFKLGTDGSSFATIYPFAGGPNDGSGPGGSLVQSGQAFYGTTGSGGTSGDGTIFKVNADGSGRVILHSFSGGANDGRDPVSGALALSNGMLYGMTALGGTTNGGVVYRIGTDGTGFTVLHSFDLFNLSEGNTPFGQVTVVGTTIYGMTKNGGRASQFGTIFKMSIDGTGFTVLHAFRGGSTDGRNPPGELVLDASGSTLYGLTQLGGTADLGTLFSLGLDGSGYHSIYSFLGGPNDGAQPFSDPLLIGSTAYVTTAFGGTSNLGTIEAIGIPEPSTILLAGLAALAIAARLGRHKLRSQGGATKSDAGC
jgi:uncharacterized repeat protein (TIGR03803 family)